MSIEKEIGQDLLDIKAVQIRSDHYFTWTSGIKSPIYCDNRLIMSYPAIRKKVIKAFIDLMEENNIKPDVIAGCATAGIPHAAWLSAALDLPMVYVRSKPKAHGKGNQIEGIIHTDQKVLVIEDLISTGGSSIESAIALKKAGAEVLGVYAIFSYGLKQAKENFEINGLTYRAITDFDKLIEILVKENHLNEEEKSNMLSWRNNLTF